MLLLTACGPEEEETDPGALPEPVAKDLAERTRAEQEKWREPSAEHAGKTAAYLASTKGRLLTDFAARSKRLEDDITPSEVTDGCRRLVDAWQREVPGDQLQDRLGNVGDAPLVNTTTEQLSSVLGAFDHCGNGDLKKARHSARVASAWSDMFQRRVAQLEVKP
ncbi:hypothetical protein ACIBLA_19490 [Streptomyces sp. NPDC050433]|uniref:hypothetical protein n=1 Tax=Streptomyces sp. NPDC050433 TaxID=3365615 RepID=UPI0037A84081